MGISGIPFGISGGEDGVKEDEGADDLDGQAGAFAVAVGESVGAAAVAVVLVPLQGLDQGAATDGAYALGNDVQQGAHQ